MISWLTIGYRLLLVARFAQMFIFNTYRVPNDYADVAECFGDPETECRYHAKSADAAYGPTKTVLFPLLINELGYLLRNISAGRLVSCRLTSHTAVRLACYCLSLLNDYFLFKIAKRWRIKPNLARFLYACSNVPFVFLTYLRSALVETVLFSAMLFVVIKAPLFSESCSPSSDTTGHGGSCTGGKRVKFADGSLPTSKCMADHGDISTRKGAFWLGILVTAGIFNRPNFLAFALTPLLHWLVINGRPSSGDPFDDPDGGISGWRLFFRKIVWLSLGVIFTTLLLAIVDSLAIGVLSIDRLSGTVSLTANFSIESLLSLMANNLTWAPWNALRSTLSFQNLQNQQLHPWYTHLLVNTPFLFGSMGVLTIYYFCQCFQARFLIRLHYMNPRYWLLLSSFMVPLLLLSIYPRQNLEDLIPLTIPLVLVGTFRLTAYSQLVQNRLIVVWCTWNLFVYIYYGVLYNGGLYQCAETLRELRNTHETSSGSSNSFSYYFWATDAPPRTWLVGDERRQHRNSVSSFSYAIGNVRQLDSALLEHTTENNSLVFLVAPSTLSVCRLPAVHNRTLVASLLREFTWHYSSFSPPDIWQLLACTRFGDRRFSSSTCALPCKENKLQQLAELLTLRLYRVVSNVR